MTTLVLEVARFDDARRWDWRLLDASGQGIEYGEVSLGPPGADGTPAEGTAEWIRRQVDDASKRSVAMEEARRWLGEKLLPEVGPAIATEAPVTVHVRIPSEATALLSYPLELASVLDEVDDTFLGLAENDVAFVYEIVPGTSKPAAKKDPVGSALRVLAIFSEAVGASSSKLYVERRRLASQIDVIAKQRDKSIELRILSYGMTRKQLRDTLEEGQRWDVVHISGYGLIDGLAMWGSGQLSMTELAKELKQIRSRLKVITLIDREQPEHPHADGEGLQAQAVSSAAVATGLAHALDCAVLAFRYPACETYAATFAQELFVNLIGKKEQSLPGALQLATKTTVQQVAGDQGWCSRPGPVLFGLQATDLFLAPPDLPRILDYNVRALKMAFFPDEPTCSDTPMETMARAANALSPDSGYRGVVLVGPHANTRSSALELAYGRQKDFSKLVWHQGPRARTDVRRSFDDLIRSLDRQLDKLRMAEQADTIDALRDFAPLLTELLETRLVLVVIADVDLLLSSRGDWKDPAWELVMKAMCEHDGDSRLVITSARIPRGMDDRMDVAAVAPAVVSDCPIPGPTADRARIGGDDGIAAAERP